MSRGNWTAGLFADERASIYAQKALTEIFSGKAGGTHRAAVDPGREASSASNADLL